MTDYDYDYDEFEDQDADDSEWRAGQCDRCMMAPGETVELGPFFVGCACAMGQGAPPELCECGPR